MSRQLSMPFDDDDRVHAKTRAEEILRLLRECPKLSSELKVVNHRFSASINDLRDRGYVITGDKMPNRDWLWTLHSFTPNEEVDDFMQDAYYFTPHWQAKRKERLQYDGYRCCHCKVTADLHVHHWRYELFAEDIEHVTTLCKKCHTEIHANPNVTIHFPRYVTPGIAVRLREAIADMPIPSFV